MPWSKKIITELSDEILNGFSGWYGPNGLCWCDEKQKYVKPGSCDDDCPECSVLNSQDIKEFRYLHLHDDFKSF